MYTQHPWPAGPTLHYLVPVVGGTLLGVRQDLISILDALERLSGIGLHHGGNMNMAGQS